MSATTTIRHVVGDATRPEGSGVKIIAHVVNDRGGWGAGFSGALGRAYPGAETAYREANASYAMAPGRTHIHQAAEDVFIAHMWAQRGYKSPENPHPLNLDDLRRCLKSLASAAFRGETIHMPRLGAGLGGGDWPTIEKIIAEELAGHDVTVYTLPERAATPPMPREAPIVCRIHSPKRDFPFVYTDLEKALAKIAEARDLGGYLLIAVAGSRNFRQPDYDRPDPADPQRRVPVPEEERPGRLEYTLIAAAVQKLCRLRGHDPAKVCIVSGGARGVDRVAEAYAYDHKLPCVVFPADWEGKGGAAGPERNAHVVGVAAELLALPGKDSIGTWDAIRKARGAMVPVTVL